MLTVTSEMIFLMAFCYGNFHQDFNLRQTMNHPLFKVLHSSVPPHDYTQ